MTNKQGSVPCFSPQFDKSSPSLDNDLMVNLADSMAESGARTMAGIIGHAMETQRTNFSNPNQALLPDFGTTGDSRQNREYVAIPTADVQKFGMESATKIASSRAKLAKISERQYIFHKEVPDPNAEESRYFWAEAEKPRQDITNVLITHYKELQTHDNHLTNRKLAHKLFADLLATPGEISTISLRKYCMSFPDGARYGDILHLFDIYLEKIGGYQNLTSDQRDLYDRMGLRSDKWIDVLKGNNGITSSIVN